MRAVYAVAAAAFLGRLILFAGLELYADEAYYWTWSLRPAFGYFDHPPMVAYLAWLGRFLPGELGLRVPFALCGALVVIFAAYAAREVSVHPYAPLWAALLAATSPMLILGGSLTLPDAPLEAAFAAATWLVLTARGRRWLVVGLAAGLALLSKYSAGLFAPAVLAGAAIDSTLRAELRTRWPWLGAVVAALIFAPCLAWNASHDFVSIRFQVGHGFGGRGSTGDAVAFLGAVIAGAGPIVLITGVAFLVQARAPAALRLAAVVGVPLGVTAVAAFGSHVQGNWPALVYPGLCAAAGAFVAALGKTLARVVGGASVALGVGLAIGYAVELRAPRLFAPHSPPIERFHGWRDAAAGVRRVIGEPVPFVVASNYQIAAELAYYGGLRRFGPTFVRPSQFDIWNDRPEPGEGLVLVSLLPVDEASADKMLGRTAAPPVPLETHFGGARVRTLWVTLPMP
jgi:hypothetical protein